MRIKILLTFIALFLLSSLSFGGIVPTGSLNLPSCSFSDSSGIWVKPKDCDWSSRALLGSGKKAECRPWWSAFQPHTTWTSSLYTGSVTTSAPAGIGEATSFCKIEPVSLDYLPACPFSGNPGDVYVKPRFNSGLWEWKWSDGRCKIGEECSVIKSFNLAQVLLMLGLITPDQLAIGTVEIEVGKLIKSLTGIDLPIEGKIKIDLKVHLTIGPELYTHQGTDTAWCGTKIPPIFTGTLPCDVCVIRDPSISSCKDSDNGKNPNIKGSVTIGSTTYEDYCVGYDKVMEYYCDKDAGRLELFDCPQGCSNGACIGGVTTIPQATCSGRCGRFYSGLPCQCDEDCRRRGDCCSDVCRACPNLPFCQVTTIPPGPTTIPTTIVTTIPTTLPPGPTTIPTTIVTTIPTTIVSTTTTTISIPASCAGRCGNYNPQAPCQCDNVCHLYRGSDGCCQDICRACPTHPSCLVTTIPQPTTIPTTIPTTLPPGPTTIPTTIPQPSGQFIAKLFTCTQIVNGYRCYINYDNQLGENANLIFIFLDSKGKVVSISLSTAQKGEGTVSGLLFCDLVGKGIYRVYWKAYRESDLLLANPVAWAKSYEMQTINC